MQLLKLLNEGFATIFVCFAEEISKALDITERVFKVLDNNEKISDAGDSNIENINGVIEFKDVSFGYKKDQWIFNIQGNKEVAPTLLFMIQAGVPVETAVYFVSTSISSLLPSTACGTID